MHLWHLAYNDTTDMTIHGWTNGSYDTTMNGAAEWWVPKKDINCGV